MKPIFLCVVFLVIQQMAHGGGFHHRQAFDALASDFEKEYGNPLTAKLIEDVIQKLLEQYQAKVALKDKTAMVTPEAEFFVFYERCILLADYHPRVEGLVNPEMIYAVSERKDICIDDGSAPWCTYEYLLRFDKYKAYARKKLIAVCKRAGAKPVDCKRTLDVFKRKNDDVGAMEFLQWLIIDEKHHWDPWVIELFASAKAAVDDNKQQKILSDADEKVAKSIFILLHKNIPENLKPEYDASYKKSFEFIQACRSIAKKIAED